MSAKEARQTDVAPAGLHAKLVWVRSRIGSVEKSKVNQHLRYEYRTEDDYYNAVRPLLDEAGVMLYVSCAAARLEGKFFVVEMDYTFVDAATGDSWATRAMGAADAEAKDKPDSSGLKKAQTGAARYLFQKLFLIADGADDEADHGRPATPPARPPADEGRPDPKAAERRREREAELKDLAARAKVPLKTALEKAGKTSIADLSDGELTAWVAKMRKKVEATADPAITAREAGDLRSAFQERGVPPAEWLKQHGIESGLVEDCTASVYNTAMTELFN